MARIRTIKPEFWISTQIGQCSIPARLLFVASWNFADDFGRLPADPDRLKAQAFPLDPVEVASLVGELIAAGLVAEYDANGQKFWQILGWLRHQKIDKRGAARYPEPTAANVTDYGKDPGNLARFLADLIALRANRNTGPAAAIRGALAEPSTNPAEDYTAERKGKGMEKETERRGKETEALLPLRFICPDGELTIDAARVDELRTQYPRVDVMRILLEAHDFQHRRAAHPRPLAKLEPMLHKWLEAEADTHAGKRPVLSAREVINQAN